MTGATAAAIGAGVSAPIAAASIDPIFAAIEADRALEEKTNELSMAFSALEDAAEAQHGPRPIALVVWRSHYIGDAEIDVLRRALLAQPGADSERIELEYRDAKARCSERIRAGEAWDERTGIAALREQLKCAEAPLWEDGRLATIKPTTPAGAGALVAYAADYLERFSEEWALIALQSAADALAGMS